MDLATGWPRMVLRSVSDRAYSFARMVLLQGGARGNGGEGHACRVR